MWPDAQMRMASPASPRSSPATNDHGRGRASHTTIAPATHPRGTRNLDGNADRRARATRAGAQAIGLDIYGDADERSTVVTAVELGGRDSIIDGGKVPGALRKLGITANGGQDQLKGRIIRIAHCGYFGAFDILTSLSGLEMALSQLGHEVEHGAGVGAAQRVFVEAGVAAAA